MAYHTRIETADEGNLITTRTRNSELWFINNPKLEEEMLSWLAKCSEREGVKLYAFAIEGSHHHEVAAFPRANRAEFMRNFNSVTAKAVAKHVKNYPGGSLYGRRYSNEFLPENKDIEKYFFYTVLQPVKDGLVDKISNYPWYNCFHDAVHGIKRKYKHIDWKAYKIARKYNKKAKVRDFTKIYTLEYQRLPGYENLSQTDYKKMMYKKLEERRQLVLKERIAQGKTSFVGVEGLLAMVPGTPALNPKVSKRNSKRPRVLTSNPRTMAKRMSWYFAVLLQYKECSQRYRSGEQGVKFPSGTYKPIIFTEPMIYKDYISK